MEVDTELARDVLGGAIGMIYAIIVEVSGPTEANP